MTKRVVLYDAKVGGVDYAAGEMVDVPDEYVDVMFQRGMHCDPVFALVADEEPVAGKEAPPLVPEVTEEAPPAA